MEFSQLKNNLKKNYTGLKKIKLALLSDSATQFISIALRGYGYEAGYDFEIYEALYGQIERELLDTTSGFYEFRPEFVILFQTPQKLLEQFYLLNPSEKEHFSTQHIARITAYYQAIITAHPSCKIVYANFPDYSDAVFGNYANKLAFSFEYQLRKLNVDLMQLSQMLPNFYLNDICKLHAHHGSAQFFDIRMYHVADTAYAIPILPVIAKNTMDVIRAILGDFKKCLILDLDNTLWGGVIGDEGVEGIEIGQLGMGKAYSAFQAWIKQLKMRGIILAVCSQNYEEVAKIPFLQHPDMILTLEDIAVFIANWKSKVENIQSIQQVLNINFDAMVFVDDDAYQRNLVRTYLPDICVPELPNDASEYTTFLANLNLFEVANYSEEDQARGEHYQEEMQRLQLKSTFTQESDYLINLEMSATILPFDTFTLPRVTQLIQRSNQFNLRTIRYSEEELQRLLHTDNAIPMAFSLHDKYGNYGVVSVVILKADTKDQLFIDTWIMSCRVLKRGLEDLVLTCLCNIAKNGGYNRLIGEYIPTNKNQLVSKHYEKMGFKPEASQWHLDIQHYTPQKYYMTLKGWEAYAARQFTTSN